MLKQTILAVLLSFMTASGAWALELHDAKSQGLVGEANTGYLAPVRTPPSAEVQTLMNQVNGARRDKFNATAKANNLSVDQVATRFYQRALQATPSGQYYQDTSGRWARKP